MLECTLLDVINVERQLLMTYRNFARFAEIIYEEIHGKEITSQIGVVWCIVHPHEQSISK